MFIDLKEILKDNRVVNGEIIYEAGSVVSELTLKDFLFRKGDDGYTYEPCPNGVYLFFEKEDSKETECLYVGKCSSRSFIERIPSHFDAREKAWFHSFLKAHLVYLHYPAWLKENEKEENVENIKAYRASLRKDKKEFKEKEYIESAKKILVDEKSLFITFISVPYTNNRLYEDSGEKKKYSKLNSRLEKYLKIQLEPSFNRYISEYRDVKGQGFIDYLISLEIKGFKNKDYLKTKLCI